MDSIKSKGTLKVRLPASLIDKLEAHAVDRHLTKGEVVRAALERAVTSEATAQRVVESSTRFAHLALDAILRDLCPDGVREEVHEAHKRQRVGQGAAAQRGATR